MLDCREFVLPAKREDFNYREKSLHRVWIPTFGWCRPRRSRPYRRRHRRAVGGHRGIAATNTTRRPSLPGSRRRPRGSLQPRTFSLRLRSRDGPAIPRCCKQSSSFFAHLFRVNTGCFICSETRVRLIWILVVPVHCLPNSTLADVNLDGQQGSMVEYTNPFDLTNLSCRSRVNTL